MTVTYALFRAFLSAFMLGLGVGILFGFIRRFMQSILDVVD
jgi:hypothetical protein